MIKEYYVEERDEDPAREDARLLRYDEVVHLPLYSEHWFEFNLPHVKSLHRQFLLGGHVTTKKMKDYNLWWRIWERRPTKDRMREVAWRNQ